LNLSALSGVDPTMHKKDVRFSVDEEEYSLDVDFGKAEVVIHTPSGDITANWEEGEGLYNIRGLSMLDDDLDVEVDDILAAAEKKLDSL
jgi:hypothetical protein